MEEELDLSLLSDQELDELYDQVEELSKTSYRDYEPHAVQKAFHNSLKRIRLMLGGNRSGKTVAGSIECIWHATGDYPEEHKGKRFMQPTRGRIVVSDFKASAIGVIEPKLKEYLPKEKIKKIHRFMGHIEKVEVWHKSGGVSVFDIMTHEQSDKQFEGWSGHWVWFDEPPPREKWKACWRGLTDYRGHAWMTMTPISEPWIKDELVDAEGALAELIECFEIDTRENPYIGDDEKREFEAGLSEDEKESRLKGHFAHLIGRVYKQFNQKVHCVLEADLPKTFKEWPVYFVLDPADRRPHHAIWFRVDPFGTIWIFQDFVFAGDIKETCKEILGRELMMDIRPQEVIRILDPNKGKSPNGAQGMVLEHEFASHAVYFTTNVNDDLTLGHLAVREKLKYDENKPLSGTNHPKLYFVTENTKVCVKQMMSYVWDDWRGVAKGAKSPKQAVKDYNKDMPDCVRYGVVFNPQYYSPDRGNNGEIFNFLDGETTSYQS